MSSSPSATPPEPLHILVIPKWWPNARDPQLGDFIRKQMQAVASMVKVTVLQVEGVPGVTPVVEAREVDGLFLVRSAYPASEHPSGPVRKVLNSMRYWRASMAGLEQVFALRGVPALTHVHILVRPALLAWWIKKKWGIPYVLSEQSSEYLDGTYGRKGPLFHWISRQLFKGASGISAVSAWLGDGLTKLGLCDRYTIIPNVIPGLDRPVPPRGPAGRFLVVADLVDKTKNVSGVIKALSLLKRAGTHLELTIIGDGPDRPMLEALALREEVATTVTFLGRLPNSAVLDHMANTGVVIVNSNVETFSVVTGEALVQGKPVIATRCGGPQAFITPNNGQLIEVGDTHGLAEAMKHVYLDHTRYDPATIRSDVSTRFSPDAVGRAFLDLYRQTLRH